MRYANDLIVVSWHSEEWLYRKPEEILEGELGLKINRDKSRILDVEKEAVEYLGFEIRRVRSKKTGKMFALCYPSKKAVKAIYEKIKRIADPSIPIKAEEMIRRLNRLLRGWVNYFRIGNASQWFSKLRDYVEKKVRRSIRKKRHEKGFGWKAIKGDYLYKNLGLYSDYRVSWRRA